MQNDSQEKFMVRTVKVSGDSYVYENTLASGRPEAVRQAERIGQIEDCDHSLIRLFLEGFTPKCKSFEVLAKGVGGYNSATIYQID